MSKKKAKRIPYTRKQLAEAKKQGGDNPILSELRTNFIQGIKMSRAETELAASMVKFMMPVDSISFLSLSNFIEGQEQRFIDLYFAYFQDLEGKHGITKFSGNLMVKDRVVPIEEKREDVIRLNEIYSAWLQNFAHNRHKDVILNTVINEINKTDLDEVETLLRDGVITQAEYEYKKKGTILLSKYLYIKVSTAFEELKGIPVQINFAGKVIEITPWTMVHVLNRHYAAAAKQFDVKKSFHGDPTIKFFEDPEQLKPILEEIGAHPDIQQNDVVFIPFKYNGVVYSIHTEKQKRDNGTPYIRMQTFYPTELQSELDTIKNEFNEISIRKDLAGYQKK